MEAPKDNSSLSDHREPAVNTIRLGAAVLSLALAMLLPIQGAAQTRTDPNESQLTEAGHYTNKDGNLVHSPAHSADGRVPVGATAHCRDGTYSFSKHHSGTCSGHHGV